MRVYEAYINEPKDERGSCFRKFYGYDLRNVKRLCRLIAGKGGAFSVHLGNVLTGKCVYQYV